jgi:hypothetical protein
MCTCAHPYGRAKRCGFGGQMLHTTGTEEEGTEREDDAGPSLTCSGPSLHQGLGALLRRSSGWLYHRGHRVQELHRPHHP